VQTYLKSLPSLLCSPNPRTQPVPEVRFFFPSYLPFQVSNIPATFLPILFSPTGQGGLHFFLFSLLSTVYFSIAPTLLLFFSLPPHYLVNLSFFSTGVPTPFFPALLPYVFFFRLFWLRYLLTFIFQKRADPPPGHGAARPLWFSDAQFFRWVPLIYFHNPVVCLLRSMIFSASFPARPHCAADSSPHFFVVPLPCRPFCSRWAFPLSPHSATPM